MGFKDRTLKNAEFWRGMCENLGEKKHGNFRGEAREWAGGP
jgi:hypothetical protein